MKTPTTKQYLKVLSFRRFLLGVIYLDNYLPNFLCTHVCQNLEYTAYTNLF